MGVASGPGNFLWEIGNYAFNKKVHNRNCFFNEKYFQNSTSKMAENWISICNSTGRSDIWDKFHEL